MLHNSEASFSSGVNGEKVVFPVQAIAGALKFNVDEQP